MGTLPSLYEVLGVDPRAPLEDVRSAYRTLAREYHPDVNPDPRAHEHMAKINEAFEVLGDPVRRMEYDTSIGNSVFLDPSADSTVRRPTAVTATLLYRHRDHRSPVYGVGFSPRMGRLFSCSFENELIAWSEDLERSEHQLRLDGGAVSGLTVVDEGRLVAVGSTEQSVTCWNVRGREVSMWRQSPRAWVTTLVASPDGASVALGSVDNKVRVVSADRGRDVFIGRSHTDSVTALAWSRDSRTLATGSADASVKRWDARSGTERQTLQPVRSTVTSIAFSPDGRWIAVAAVDLSIRVFDVRSGALKQKFFGHSKPVEALAFHPHNSLLASGSRDGTVGLWSIKSGIGHGQIMASHQSVACLAFNPKGDRLAAGGLDKVLRIWALSVPD